MDACLFEEPMEWLYVTKLNNLYLYILLLEVQIFGNVHVIGEDLSYLFPEILPCLFDMIKGEK